MFVVLVVVVRRIDVGAIEVQVVRVGAAVLGRRPVVAVATLIVEPAIPVATVLSKIIYNSVSFLFAPVGAKSLCSLKNIA